MRLVCFALIGAVLAAPTIAETPPRCALLGQMAVSSWLQMMGGLGSGTADAVDPALARLANLTTTYAALDCDTTALTTATDCLLARVGEDMTPPDLARTCMSAAGISSE